MPKVAGDKSDYFYILSDISVSPVAFPRPADRIPYFLLTSFRQ
nr:MAG TPA: hypothetical protein [Bacteriophage sp.]